MVPATSIVEPEPPSARAWLMVAQGALAEHGFMSLPVADTNTVVAAPAGAATTNEVVRLPTRPRRPTSGRSSGRRRPFRLEPRSSAGTLVRRGIRRDMRRPLTQVTEGYDVICDDLPLKSPSASGRTLLILVRGSLRSHRRRCLGWCTSH